MGKRRYKQDPQQKPQQKPQVQVRRVRTTLVELGKLQFADAGHILTDLQKSQIADIKRMFQEVRPLSQEEWEAGFASDFRCEREIALWQMMGRTYTDFVREMGIRSPAARMEVYDLILLASLGVERAQADKDFPRVLSPQTFSLLASILWQHQEQN